MEIDWKTVDPALLPEGSPLQLALLDGRPDVAEWIASTYPDGARLYVHAARTVRRWVFAGEVRRLLAVGTSRRAVARRLGVSRGALRREEMQP